MAYENKSFGENTKNNESIFSKRVKAGKRRTYFFDVKATRGNDYFITITESKKRFEDDGYDRHKMFIYKEDFNKFAEALVETVNYVKTDLMPDFDFDAFNHADDQEQYEQSKNDQSPKPSEQTEAIENPIVAEAPKVIDVPTPPSLNDDKDVDAWKF